MSDPVQPDARRFSRRAFFGWLGSIGLAAVVVTIIGTIERYLSNVPGLTSWNPSRPGHTAGHDRAKLTRLRRKTQQAYAASNSNLVLVQQRDPARRLRSSVVQWPHPLLFARRPALRSTHRILKNDEWKGIVRPRCGKGRPWAEASTTHFVGAHEATIREYLALGEISFDGSDSTQGLDMALSVLAPLFGDDRNRCNWRAYFLYARLMCCQESDPERARSAVLLTVWNRPSTEAKPKQIAFLWSADEFRKWHKKTRTERFLKRLRGRTEFARLLRGGQSSSGQDTASAERDRSNRPRPLASKGMPRARKLKLVRRKERRGAAKKITLWNRINILWNHSTRQIGPGDLSPKTTAGPRKVHLLKARHANGHKLKCKTPVRKQPCVPVAGKSRGRPILHH